MLLDFDPRLESTGLFLKLNNFFLKLNFYIILFIDLVKFIRNIESKNTKLKRTIHKMN